MFDRSAHLYDLLYSFKDYDGEARDLVALIRDRNASATSLLDVACGTAEHLRLLQPTFDVIEGVDVQSDMLEVARAKLPGVAFTCADMRSFDLGSTFDAVTCLFSSVGYMRDAGELEAAVVRMAAHLAPGGVLVIDGWVRPDAWRGEVSVMAHSAEADDQAVARVMRSTRRGNRTTLEMAYLAVDNEGFARLEERHVMTLFTDEEYRASFVAAGLQPDVLPGPMGPDRDRYVGVAR